MVLPPRVLPKEDKARGGPAPRAAGLLAEFRTSLVTCCKRMGCKSSLRELENRISRERLRNTPGACEPSQGEIFSAHRPAARTSAFAPFGQPRRGSHSGAKSAFARQPIPLTKQLE